MKKILVGLFIGVALVAASIGIARIGPDVTASIFRVGDGSPTAPSLSFYAEPALGFWRVSQGTIGMKGAPGVAYGFTIPSQNSDGLGLYTSGLHQSLNARVMWASRAVTATDAASSLAAVVDLALARSKAGTVKINDSGTGLGVIELGGFTFANIGTALTVNGQVGYCSDCTIANPCAAAGTGALAKRLNGVNVCN
jgi:hypothetical protein